MAKKYKKYTLINSFGIKNGIPEYDVLDYFDVGLEIIKETNRKNKYIGKISKFDAIYFILNIMEYSFDSYIKFHLLLKEFLELDCILTNDYAGRLTSSFYVLADSSCKDDPEFLALKAAYRAIVSYNDEATSSWFAGICLRNIIGHQTKKRNIFVLNELIKYMTSNIRMFRL